MSSWQKPIAEKEVQFEAPAVIHSTVAWFLSYFTSAVQRQKESQADWGSEDQHEVFFLLVPKLLDNL